MTKLTDRAELIAAIREARELGYIVCVQLNAKTTVLQAAYDDLMESLDYCTYCCELPELPELPTAHFDNGEGAYQDSQDSQDNSQDAPVSHDSHEQTLSHERLVYLEMMVTLYSFVIGLLTLVELAQATLTRLTPQAVSQLQEVYYVLKRLQPQPVNS